MSQPVTGETKTMGNSFFVSSPIGDPSKVHRNKVQIYLDKDKALKQTVKYVDGAVKNKKTGHNHGYGLSRYVVEVIPPKEIPEEIVSAMMVGSSISLLMRQSFVQHVLEYGERYIVAIVHSDGTVIQGGRL